MVMIIALHSNNTSIGDTSSLTDVSIANANAINPRC